MYCSAHESSTEVSGDKVVSVLVSVLFTVSAGTSALLVFAIVFREAFAVKWSWSAMTKWVAFTLPFHPCRILCETGFDLDTNNRVAYHLLPYVVQILRRDIA